MDQYLTPEFWAEFLDRLLQWTLGTAPTLILTLVVGLIGLRVVRIVVRKTEAGLLKRLSHRQEDTSEQAKRIGTIMGLLGSALRVVIWLMVVMLLLRSLGIDIAPLIAGAGIAGLAIGFGAQELVRDFFAGFFILLENRIRAGDVAIINGTGGMVEEVGLRTVVLRDLSGTVHVFQNGKIDTMANMTKEWSAMVFDIGVAYKEDTDRVARIMERVGAELQQDPALGTDILAPLELMGVDAFADSAVVIRARFRTRPLQQWAVGREYRRRLKKAFDAEGIEIPFPHTTLYWGGESDPMRVMALPAEVSGSRTG